MATPAVISFHGFPEQANCCLLLQHDGFPTGVAWRFALSLRISTSPEAFLNSFLHTQPNAINMAEAPSLQQVLYRYQITLVDGPKERLQVQCWRLLPHYQCWSPRCGPMPMMGFIQRFLPGELEAADEAPFRAPWIQESFSDATPLGAHSGIAPALG